MKILTLDNECFMLNNLPDELEEDVRFSVLDNSDPKDPDFFFIPLIFFGKLVISAKNAINSGYTGKFLLALPSVIVSISSYCKGSWQSLRCITSPNKN